jgi:hypothetical protein
MLVNVAHLIIAAGVLASVEVEVETVDRVQNGWIVIKGYENDLTPILTLVADVHVLDIFVAAEPLSVTVDGLTYRSHNVTGTANGMAFRATADDEEIENVFEEDEIEVRDNVVYLMAA